MIGEFPGGERWDQITGHIRHTHLRPVPHISRARSPARDSHDVCSYYQTRRNVAAPSCQIPHCCFGDSWIWSKPEKYAPILRPDTLRLIVSMAVQQRRTLKQGNCKNAFCLGILPPGEITIVKPPIGDPDAKKDEYWLLKRTLYGLRRSPKYWYDKICKILTSIGLKQNPYDPCLFSGNIIDPTDPSNSPSSSPLTLGLYVDDFVYFSLYWWSKQNLNVYSNTTQRSNIWALWNGFLVLTFNGWSPLTP